MRRLIKRIRNLWLDWVYGKHQLIWHAEISRIKLSHPGKVYYQIWGRLHMGDKWQERSIVIFDDPLPLGEFGTITYRSDSYD